MVMAVVWFIFSQILGSVQVLGRSVAQNFGAVNNTYVSMDQFLTGLFSFILTFAIFALAQWVWIYNQRRSAAYYG